MINFLKISKSFFKNNDIAKHLKNSYHSIFKTYNFNKNFKADKSQIKFSNCLKRYNFSQINNKQIEIPFYCNIFKLSQILQTDMLDLVKKYKETLKQEVIDPMEYLPKDDLELFLLECGVDFKIQEHSPILVKRPMIVTIMGHVDHGKNNIIEGKTTLLDVFRNSNLVDQEFGKITQTIGAFNLTLQDGSKLTFIDTPGHEAFTKMRQRGAKITDCIVLVISAIESVQKQVNI